MTDNFRQIKKLLNFESKDDFYFLQLIIRKKENPELGSNNRVIRSYFVKSKEALDSYEKEIKLLCNATNSRAYINLNKRSLEKMALRTMKNVCDHMMNKDFEHVHRSYTAVCGEYSDDNDKTFVLDIDKTKDGQYEHDIEAIVKFIDSECEPFDKGTKYRTIIPTKNGVHLIVKPFNLQKFSVQFPDISVHKNNPTILYVP